jgi:DNA-directed RNA polymerase subunit RPC12/RpoP
MIAAGQPCPLCEAPLAHRKLPQFSGDEAPLRITLRAMPALQCPTSHTYFVKRAFPLWLTEHLLQDDEPGLPQARSSGTLFRKYACAECGVRLARRADHRHSFWFDLSYEEGAPFAVELSMPVYRCAACGREQLHSLAQLRKLTPAALVHAFKAAGIKPPG